MGIKTLIIDDTIIYRKIVSDVIGALDQFEIVGTASNGKIALDKMKRLDVDLVFCDVYMPVMDGVETLKNIKHDFPHVLVVMMSGISTKSADITIKALELGAIDFIKKPSNSTMEENCKELSHAVKSLINLVNTRMNTSHILHRKPSVVTGTQVQSSNSTPSKSVIHESIKKHFIKNPLHNDTPTTIPKKIKPSRIAVVAIGVSTGGPVALGRLIPLLPKNLPVPIVVVQHMPPNFTKSLAESLNKKSQVVVVEGQDGDVLKPGHVYIAPGGFHMLVKNEQGKRVIHLNSGPPENSCRPAVDVLFRSVAEAYRDSPICAVILTGMGADGLNGVRTLQRRKCYCITQSASSCVVYGMPKAVEEAHLSDLSLPIEKISQEIISFFEVSRR